MPPRFNKRAVKISVRLRRTTMPKPHNFHTFEARRCRVVGREYTSEAPYVVVCFVGEDGNDISEETRVKPWELEPKLTLYPRKP